MATGRKIKMAMMRQFAITRKPSRHMQSGERMFVGRDAIDPAKAMSQHAAYCDALALCGFKVQKIEPDDSLPDCAFVEDCAVTLQEAALICRPGAVSRRDEIDIVAQKLSHLRSITRVKAPATIEGGDVLRFGNRILIGASCRTNADGIAIFRRWAESLGFGVTECIVKKSLHLKTGCTFLPDGALLANRDWVELPRDVEVLSVSSGEPFAGNILLANRRIIAATSQPRTNQMLRDRGFDLIEVDISEFQKAEGGVTCLSILVGVS